MRTKSVMFLAGIIFLALCVNFTCLKKTSTKETAPPDMVLVPAGKFFMGMNANEAFKECQKYNDYCIREWFTDEEPMHKVYLDAFYIDQHEVTQAEYDQCVDSQKCKANKKFEGFTDPRQPVVGVSWDDARNYCAWAGKRLPSEAEWEKAARGTDGRMYPWGNEFDWSKVNGCDKNCQSLYANEAWNDGHKYTAPVGSYPSGASPYGALDMAGNVDEWTADWYQKEYYKKSPSRNPKGPDSGSCRVLRGGGWFEPQRFLLTTNRNCLEPGGRLDIFGSIIGFRCARD